MTRTTTTVPVPMYTITLRRLVSVSGSPPQRRPRVDAEIHRRPRDHCVPHWRPSSANPWSANAFACCATKVRSNAPGRVPTLTAESNTVRVLTPCQHRRYTIKVNINVGTLSRRPRRYAAYSTPACEVRLGGVRPLRSGVVSIAFACAGGKRGSRALTRQHPDVCSSSADVHVETNTGLLQTAKRWDATAHNPQPSSDD